MQHMQGRKICRAGDLLEDHVGRELEANPVMKQVHGEYLKHPLLISLTALGVCRADHLLKDHLSRELEADPLMKPDRREYLKHLLATLDELEAKELGEKIKEFGILSPDDKNPLSDPYPFNLMFATAIGPTGLQQGYVQGHRTPLACSASSWLPVSPPAQPTFL